MSKKLLTPAFAAGAFGFFVAAGFVAAAVALEGLAFTDFVEDTAFFTADFFAGDAVRFELLDVPADDFFSSVVISVPLQHLSDRTAFASAAQIRTLSLPAFQFHFRY